MFGVEQGVEAAPPSHKKHSSQQSLTPSPSREGEFAVYPANKATKSVDVLLAKRVEFHRFLAARVGVDADDLLQQSLLKAWEKRGTLRCGERAVAWFYRILRNAVADHYRQKAIERQRADRVLAEMTANGNAAPSKVSATVVCACFHELLTVLKPRYAELIRRIDLNGESKKAVSRELKITPGTMDVALHRARYALRKRIQAVCGTCSHGKCLDCFCIEERV